MLIKLAEFSNLTYLGNDKPFKQPKWNLILYGERAFSYQVPMVWNNLPRELKNATSLDTSRKHLKTHLYLLAFG